MIRTEATPAELDAALAVDHGAMTMHDCQRMTNGRSWTICSVCGGRVHYDECTTKRDKRKDCCEARHKMLFEQGQTVGVNDTSLPMYDAAYPTYA